MSSFVIPFILKKGFSRFSSSEKTHSRSTRSAVEIGFRKGRPVQLRSTSSPPTPIEPLSEESLEREGVGAEFRYHYLNRKISTKARKGH